MLDVLSHFSWLSSSKNVAATALTSLVFVVGIVGQCLGGRAAERFQPRRVYLLFHSLALPMALGMAYTMNLPLLLVTMGYLLFLLGMQPAENTLVANLTPDKLGHSAYGTKFILTFGVGALAMRLVGWIKQTWSLGTVYIAMAMISALIVMFILVLYRVTRDLKSPGGNSAASNQRVIAKPLDESSGA